jgi:hypothetical protein
MAGALKFCKLCGDVTPTGFTQLRSLYHLGGFGSSVLKLDICGRKGNEFVVPVHPLADAGSQATPRGWVAHSVLR